MADAQSEITQTPTYMLSSFARERYLNQCVPLHKAALRGDWKTAEKLFTKDFGLAKARITEGGETALHLASVEGHTNFVTNLLENLEQSDVEILSEKGNTTLSYAAAAGHVNIAKLLVEKNHMLPTIHGSESVTPLYIAAILGHKEMANYLFPLSGFGIWSTDNQIMLLTTTIESGLYGLAKRIVDQNNTLAVVEDSNGMTPLEVLARNASAFGSKQQESWGNTILSYAKLKPQKSTAECDAYALLSCLWDHVIRQEDIENQHVGNNTAHLLFAAAESGNDEFLVELIRRYPDFVYKMNVKQHSIFHIAVLHRHVQAFNLIYELSGMRYLIASYIDTDGSNILHLAGKLAPQSQLNNIPGAALQMQREVLWYKEVEKIVQPSFRNMKNLKGQTPYDLFLEEHENLTKQGERFMKQIAKSCMLVTILIATLVFTTAFTVPGGYDNSSGAPILEKYKVFMFLPISEAVATLSSFTSMLMFLAILTSRFKENDFLNSLPYWLVIGVTALFISIVAMTVAFCTCLLFYQHGLAAVTILLVFFPGVPVMFIFLKYRLLVTVLRCTYSCRWMFCSNNRLLN